MSKAPVVTSVDVNVRAASHLSKVPSMATDAFTENLTELSSVVILKTGTCARLSDGNTADAKKKKTANRMLPCARISDMHSLPPVAMKATKRIPNSSWTMTVDVCSEVLSNVTGRSRKVGSAQSAVVGRKQTIRLSPARPDIRAVSQFADRKSVV